MHGRKWVKLLIGLFILGTAVSGNAQVQGKLYALDSMIMVGNPFKVQMEITHPEEMVVIFPDSDANFFPYELYRARAFPTQTFEGRSTDKKLFRLYTWEIDSIQTLTLPYWYVKNGDTIQEYANQIRFQFLPTLPARADTSQVRFQEGYYDLDGPKDYTLLFIILGSVLVGLALAGFLLYKPILNRIKKWRIEKEWKKYQGKFDQLPGLLPRQTEFIVSLNHLWKEYLDRRHHVVLRSLSTAELKHELQSFEGIGQQEAKILMSSNRSGDMILYAGQRFKDQDLMHLHSEIVSIMETEYLRRKEALEDV